MRGPRRDDEHNDKAWMIPYAVAGPSLWCAAAASLAIGGAAHADHNRRAVGALFAGCIMVVDALLAAITRPMHTFLSNFVGVLATICIFVGFFLHALHFLGDARDERYERYGVGIHLAAVILMTMLELWLLLRALWISCTKKRAKEDQSTVQDKQSFAAPAPEREIMCTHQLNDTDMVYTDTGISDNQPHQTWSAVKSWYANFSKIQKHSVFNRLVSLRGRVSPRSQERAQEVSPPSPDSSIPSHLLLKTLTIVNGVHSHPANGNVTPSESPARLRPAPVTPREQDGVLSHEMVSIPQIETGIDLSTGKGSTSFNTSSTNETNGLAYGRFHFF